MTDRLVVKNFSVLKNIDIKINNINIIIGDQAQGKSLISKIVYFFNKLRSYLVEMLVSSEEDMLNSTNIKNTLIKKFYDLFPKYLIEQNKDFEIKYYYYSNIKTPFKIVRKNGDLNLVIPKNLAVILDNLNKELKEQLSKIDIQNMGDNRIFKIEMLFKKIDKVNLVDETLLIPAMRSFFSYLQDNVFFDNLILNTVTKDFGQYLQKTKYITSNINKEIFNNNILKKISTDLLKGEYFRKDKTDFIKSIDGTEIKLSDASSGQQEIFPILRSLDFNSHLHKYAYYFYIMEEPEAHLFPSTQKKVINLLAYIYNLHKTSKLLITTHSPYILTSLNNLIQAHNTYKLKPNLEKEISKVVSKDIWVKFENVSAYYLNNGKCIDILDSDSNLINTDFIDEISNEISSEFSRLLDIGYDD
jgi:predicted ATPase